MAKNIPGLADAAPLQLTNRVEVSQSDSPSANSVRTTYQDVINDIVNPNTQLGSSAQVTGLPAALNAKLNLSGGTMLGELILSGDPTYSLDAATKQYVDNTPGSKISGTTNQINVGVDGYNVILSTPQNIDTASTPTFKGITLTQTLTGITPSLNLNSMDGSYINFGAAGRNIGVQDMGNFFMSINLDYNATTNQYVYTANGSATAVVLNDSLGSLVYAASGAGSANATIQNSLTWDVAGNVNVPNGSLNVGTSTPSASAALQIASTTQGFLPPDMTNSEFSSIPSPATGLLAYQTDYGSYGFYNGSSYDTLLSIGNLKAGTNITFNTSTPGQVTINASGGGSSPAAAYASFGISNNTVATTFSATSTFYPIYLGTSFIGNDSSSFTNQFLTISGRSTPVMTYTGSTTQFVNVNINLSCRGATATSSTYNFSLYIVLANGTVVPTEYRNTLTLGDLVNYYDVSLTGNIQLNTGDSVFVEVQNITGTNSMYAAYATASTISLAGTGTASGTAGGDLTGTYPNPTLATVNSNTGNFGDATHTNTLTLDAKGRVTAASSNLITPAGIGAPTTTGTGASGTWGISISGNAATATALQNSQTINGVTFNGTSSITIPAAAGTLTGTTLNSTVVTSSLTSVGTISSGTWSGSFGTVSGANLTSLTAANISAGTAGISISGNAATATTATNATNAANVGLISTSSSSTYYVSFALNQSGNSAIFTNSGFSVVPSSGLLNLPQISLTGTGQSFLVANNGELFAKNSSGTAEVFLIPRYTDNVMYMNYGSGGFNIRNDSGTGALFMTNGLDMQPQGNVQLQVAGKTFSIKSGSNACIGSVSLSGASTTVLTSAVATGDHIHLAVSPPGGTQGLLSYSISTGVSFTITSTTTTLDTSTVLWDILKAS